MLNVIIEENEFSQVVPKGFEKAMLAFVCISFLLSPLQLVEIKIRGSRRWKIRRLTPGLRTTLQIICVNCVFLGLRMYLWRSHEKDSSIFIAKNAIFICLCLFEICSICECCVCDDYWAWFWVIKAEYLWSGLYCRNEFKRRLLFKWNRKCSLSFFSLLFKSSFLHIYSSIGVNSS